MEPNTSTMTVKQIEAAINAEIARLDRADAILAEARQGREQIEQFGHADNVRDALLDEYEATMTKAEQDAAKAADIADANARQVIDQLASSRTVLTPSETVTAAARRDFVTEDVNSGSLEDLIAALRDALMTEDRADLWLYQRYLPARIKASDSSWADTASADDVDTLRRLLREAGDRLRNTSLDPLRKRAGDVLSRAGKVERNALKRERASRTYEFQTAGGEVAW